MSQSEESAAWDLISEISGNEQYVVCATPKSGSTVGCKLHRLHLGGASSALLLRAAA